MAIIKAGTYRFNDTISKPENILYGFITFQANDTTFVNITNSVGSTWFLYYEEELDYGGIKVCEVSEGGIATWNNDYQTIIIPNDKEVYDDDFYTWFTANATEVKATATIKAGKYRFNDELTVPSGAIEQSLNYELPCLASVNGVVADFNATCSMIVPYSEGINEATTTYLYFVLETISVNGEMFGFHTTEFEAYVSTEGWKSVTNAIYGFDEELAELLTDWGRTITIPADSEVSAEFYEWFTANAVEQKQISGKWKFNDVLTGNFGYLSQPVTFEYNYKYVVSQDEVAEYNAFLDEVAASNGISDDLSDVIATTYNVKMICTWMGGTEVESFGYQHSEAVTTPHSVGLSMLLPINNSNGGHDTTFYYNGWYKEEVKTIDFGTEPQTVSVEFYNWFTANATLVPEKDIYYSIKKDFLTNIANSIRAKTGKTDKMSVNQMSAEIDSITGGECEKVEEYNNIVIIEQGGGINGND